MAQANKINTPNDYPYRHSQQNTHQHPHSRFCHIKFHINITELAFYQGPLISWITIPAIQPIHIIIHSFRHLLPSPFFLTDPDPPCLLIIPIIFYFEPIHIPINLYKQKPAANDISGYPYQPHDNCNFCRENAQEADCNTEKQIAPVIPIPKPTALGTDCLYLFLMHCPCRNMYPQEHSVFILVIDLIRISANQNSYNITSADYYNHHPIHAIPSFRSTQRLFHPQTI